MFALRPRRFPDVQERRVASITTLSPSPESPARRSFLPGVILIPADSGDNDDNAYDDSSTP